MEKQKRKIALVTLVIMLLNFILPYGFIRVAEAATGNLEEKPIMFKNMGVSGDVLTIEWGVNSNEVLTGFDFQFKVRPEIGTPCQSSGAAGTTFAKVMKKATDFDEIELTQQKGTYTASTQTFRVTTTYTAGGIEQGGYQELYTLYVKLNSGVDASTLSVSDIIDLVPVTGSLPTGIKVGFVNSSGGTVSRNIDALDSDGFATATKNIDSIAVTTLPTKTTYNHGDPVTHADFAGGVLTVTYDDSSTETVALDDINVRINGSSPADVANPVVNVDYKGKSTSYNITVNDPIDGLVVTNPMATTEYNTGTALDFTGLTFNAVKRSGATVPLTQTSAGLTTSETVADVASPNFTMATGITGPEKKGTQLITFTYEGQTATQTITVNDHVTAIDVTSQPTKTIYKRGESLNLAGAVVTITLESGGTSTINLPDGSVSVSAYSPTTTGSKQNLTASMTVGTNTFTAPTTIDVEAYNYITAHTFVAPTKDTYKWGETLSLNGGRFNFTWAAGSGTPLMVNLTSSDVTVTGFNNTSIGSQLLTATYNAKYPLSDGTYVNDTVVDTFYVEVENPAKTITITAPTDAITFTHGDSLTFGNGKIDVEYTDGTHSFPAITAAMVTETATGGAVNMSPAGSDYNASTQTITKQLKIAYSQDGKSASKTYNITINNPINSIAIGTAPQSSFNVNEYETSLTPGGTIVPTRKAGNTDTPVTITSAMVSGLNTTTAGSRTATVSYTDPMFSSVTKTTTYGYSVTDSTISIAINGAPTVSQYGKPLDLRTATLTVQKGSGPVTIPATSATASGFSSTTLGPQTVTLTYDGKTTTFVVTVQDYVDSISLVPNTASDILGTSLSTVISNNNLKYQVKYASESSPRPAVALVDTMVAGYNPNTATQTLTVTYTDTDTNSFTNGKTFTDSLTITLSNDVAAVNFTKEPSKKVYKYGETLDFTGAVIDLTYQNGDPGVGSITNITAKEVDGSPVNMSPAATDFDGSQKCTKTVVLTYTDPATGLNDDIIYTFDIINDIQSVAMHVAPKNSYNVGDSIDLTIGDGVTKGQILVTRAVGTPEAIDLDDPNVEITGFNTSAVATSVPVTVKYTENGIDKTTSYNINVDDIVTFIEFENAPVKTEYQYAEPIDLAGLIIKLTYASGGTDYGSINDVVVTDGVNPVNMSPATADFDSNHEVAKNLTLTYTDVTSGLSITKPYAIKIFDTVTSMTIHTPPTKLVYNVNDTLDLTDGEVKVFRASNPSVGEVLDMATYTTVTGFDSTREHATLPLTVEYTENSTTVSDSFNVQVIDSVDAITIINPPTEGKVDEPLDLSGTDIKVTYGSGDITKPATLATVSGYDPTVVGPQTVTLTYGGKSDTFTINVKDYVTGITVAPSSVNASLGDTVADLISDNSMTYTVTYKSAGAKPAETLLTSMVSTMNPTAPTQTLTVTYVDSDTDSATAGDSFTDTFSVTLANSITNVAINGTATKTTYNHGETLSLAGLSVDLTFADGTTGTGNLSDIVVTEASGSPLNMSPSAMDFGSNTTLTKTIKLRYEDATSGKYDEKMYNITIVNDIQSIDMFSTPKTAYNVGEPLDITGGEIEVTRAVGAAEIISMSDPNVQVTGFSSASEDTALPLTVKYTENGKTAQTNYTVSVVDSVTGIVIKTLPKQDYKYQEPLDVTGGVITVTKGSGSQDIPMTASMVKELSGTAFDSEILGTRDLRISYGGQHVDYEVSVKDYVTGITINPDTATGKYDDELSTVISDNSIKYTVTYAKAGAQTPVALDTAMLEATTPYDKTATTEQTLTFKYTDTDTNSATNGDEFTADLKVTLEDDITAVVMETTPKTNYEYGNPLDVTGGTIKVTRLSGDHIINIEPSMVTEMDGSPFDPTNMSTRDLKVTYEGESTTYEITIEDAVDGYNFHAPSKVTYNYGEELDISDGYIEKIMRSGATVAHVPLTSSDVTVSGYDKNTVGSQTVTVQYAGNTFTYGVAVNDGILSIAITTPPTKTTYKYGDALSTAGGIITVTYAGGRTDPISITPSMVTGYDPNTLGNQTLIVTYSGLTDTFSVNVEDYVDHIEIEAPNKLTYGIGESLDLTGATVKKVMASGTVSTPEAMTPAMVSGFDSTTEGVKTITVTYAGKTSTFGVTVSDESTGWIVATPPDKLVYRYGESLDLTGATIEITKQSGATETVAITSGMVTGYNPNRLGNQTLRVTYEGETKELALVTVEDYIKKLNVKAPTKTKYHYGEDIVLDGGTVSIVMASGAIQETTDLTASMISGYDPTGVGTQTIPVEYKGLTGSFTVNVIDEVKGISINTEPNDKDYVQGEDLDVSGGTLTVVKDSGVYTVPMTRDMASGYNTNTIGQQVITITYSGKTATYVVNVEKKPEEETPPQDSTPKTPNKPSRPGRSGGTRVIYVQPEAPSPAPEQTPTPAPEPKQEEPKQEEPKKPENTKPIRTLGEKDEKETEDKGDWRKPVLGSIIIVTLLLLILLLLLRRNVKVYVQEDKTKDEMVLGGLAKLKAKNPKLDVDKFLDEDTYPNKVKIVLNDSISEKLDGKEIEITHRGQTIKHKVKYEDEPYTFFLY